MGATQWGHTKVKPSCNLANNAGTEPASLARSAQHAASTPISVIGAAAAACSALASLARTSS